MRSTKKTRPARVLRFIPEISSAIPTTCPYAIIDASGAVLIHVDNAPEMVGAATGSDLIGLNVRDFISEHVELLAATKKALRSGVRQSLNVAFDFEGHRHRENVTINKLAENRALVVVEVIERKPLGPEPKEVIQNEEITFNHIACVNSWLRD